MSPPIGTAEAERLAVVLALLRAMAARDAVAVRVILEAEQDLAWSVAWLMLGVLQVFTGGGAEWVTRQQATVRQWLGSPGSGRPA